MLPESVELVWLQRGHDDPRLVEQVYDEVFAPSFTSDEIPEREPFVEGTATASLLVARQGGRPVAAGVYDPPDGASVGLLSYLAARPGERARGLGSSVLSAMQRHWASGPAEVVLAEVHDPRCWADHADERPLDRLRFYERHGSRLLFVPWVQPILRTGGERVGGMLLLVVGGTSERRVVPSEQVGAWMREYYLSAEGASVDGDPTLSALLERVGSSEVPVMDLDRYSELPLLEVPDPF